MEPDIILVVSNEGRTGYVQRKDLEDADGTTAAKSFRSPEDALAWQENSIAQGNVTIQVYDSDGTTVIGTFTVSAGAGTGRDNANG